MMNQTQLNVLSAAPKTCLQLHRTFLLSTSFCELTILLSQSLLDQSFTKLVEWQDVSKVSQRRASSFCANLAGIEAKRERIGFLIPTSQPPRKTVKTRLARDENENGKRKSSAQAGSDFWTTSIPAKMISRWQDGLRRWDLIFLSSSLFLPFKMSPGLIIKVDEGVLHDDVVLRIRQNSLSRASLDKLKLLGHLWTPTWS